MEIFIFVILLILVFVLLLAGILGAVKLYFDKKRDSSRKALIAEGKLIIKQLTDEEFVLASLNKSKAPVEYVATAVAANDDESQSDDVVQIPLTYEESKSLAEKYESLDKATKKLYDDFISYVEEKDDISNKETKYKTTYRKLGKKVFDITIRRDVPVLAFYQLNTELDAVLKENNAKPVKLSRINKKLKTADDVLAAEKLFDGLCTLIANNTTKRKAK